MTKNYLLTEHAKKRLKTRKIPLGFLDKIVQKGRSSKIKSNSDLVALEIHRDDVLVDPSLTDLLGIRVIMTYHSRKIITVSRDTDS
jgi:hypothetical protein